MWTATADAADRVVAFLADALAGEALGETLERVCAVIADGLSIPGVVIALGDGTEVRPVAASPAVSHLADAAIPWPGVAAGDGVRTADDEALDDDTRAALAAAGVCAVHDVHLRVDDLSAGILRLLVAHHGPLAPELGAAARLLASVTAVSVVAVGHLERARALAAQLDHALGSRVVIEQAKGVLAATSPDGDGSPPVDAVFEMLRRYARSNHRRVREVAEDIVAGRLTSATLQDTGGRTETAPDRS